MTGKCTHHHSSSCQARRTPRTDGNRAGSPGIYPRQPPPAARSASSSGDLLQVLTVCDGTRLPHGDRAPHGNTQKSQWGLDSEKTKPAGTEVGEESCNSLSPNTRILEPAVNSRALEELEARLVQPGLPSKAALSNWQLAKMVMFGLKVIIFKRFGVK